tara:strand:+ start:8554 stop:9435 length:882 start_codon:yes stop_codon:yes gene_type:complete
MYKLIIISLFIFVHGQTISDNRYIGYDASSMVGSTVASPKNMDGVFSNPASIANVDCKSISFGGGNLYGLSWLPNYYGSFVFKLPLIGNFGIGYHDLGITYMNTDLSKESSVVISSGRYILNDVNSKLSFGWGVNWMSWKTGKSAGISGDGINGLSAQTVSTYGINLGFQASLRETYRFGVFLKNINSPVIGNGLSQQELSRRLDAGVSYVPLPDVETTFTISRQLGMQNMVFSGGFKYKLNNIFDFQLGAQSNPNRFGFGFSADIRNLILTYSFLSHPVLPSTSQFGVRYNF